VAQQPPLPAPLPAPAPAAAALAAQLVSPAPGVVLEADRPQRFEVAFGAAGAAARVEGVAVGADGCGWTELAAEHAAAGADGSAGVAAGTAFAGDVVLPRSRRCVVRARLAQTERAAAAAGPAVAGPGFAAGALGEAVDVFFLHVLPQVLGLGSCAAHGRALRPSTGVVCSDRTHSRRGTVIVVAD
jgi:hypothetical protein